MRFQQLHRWDLSPAEAREVQAEMTGLVRRRCPTRRFQTVAGVDVSVKQNQSRAAVPVFRFDSMEMVDLATAQKPTTFPYVPGLLSFRELPVVLAAIAKLRVAPDVVLVDGQGIAHPRRFGLASHLGVLLDRPTIGCAKSRLCGAHDPPGELAGNWTRLVDEKRPRDLLGAVVRTRDRINPLYISVGHLIDLRRAVRTVLACCRGYRLPEPTRLAHHAAGGNLKFNKTE